MPDRSTDEAYEALLDLLRERGFGWAAAQIQEEVRAGKPVTKDVSPYRESPSRLFVGDGLVPSGSTRGRCRVRSQTFIDLPLLLIRQRRQRAVDQQHAERTTLLFRQLKGFGL